MSDYADNLRKSMINKTRRFMRMVQEMQEKDDAALREQVIRMAREVNCGWAHNGTEPVLTGETQLERFFLAAAAAGAEAEREACAKVCEGRVGGALQADGWWNGFREAMRQCAAAIRARGEK